MSQSFIFAAQNQWLRQSVLDAHGNSNHSKLDVIADFLEFVDLNTQPNGRHTGSYNAQFFFIPKFSRIAPFNIIINTLLAEEQVGRPARP